MIERSMPRMGAAVLSLALAIGVSGCAAGKAPDASPVPRSGVSADAVLVGAPPCAAAVPATAPPSVPCPCPDPCRPPCVLACESGRGSWHVRAVGGYAYGLGEDAPGDCHYYGLDVGHTSCGCLGLDAFYRTREGQFDREPLGEDGGRMHHLGVKATYEKSFGGSPWFGYAGAGPEYFWTEDYLHDDSGFGVFAEAGIGYVLHRNWRIRAGLDLHGVNSDVGRADAADDGDSRWFFTLAPSVQLEIDF